MNKKTSFDLPLALMCGCVLLSACAAPPSLVRETYGDAVRHMIDAQIYDREAAMNPGPDAVSMDGAKAEEILKTHRRDVSHPDDIQQPIIIQTGNQ
jgi:hypothetical protein